MPRNPQQTKQINAAFCPEDYLRIQHLSDTKGLTKAELVKQATLFFLEQHDRILLEQIQGPLAAEVRQTRKEIFKALKDIAFSVGQNVHLTGTILTEALPKEIRAMDHKMWLTVWNESKRYSHNYVRLVAQGFHDEENKEATQEQ